ncbi:MAG TPA: hypothetical protein VIL09_11950 [Microvirga sp.]|jgi:hypothetical protein
MTNKDMAPRPGPGPKPKSGEAPKGPKRDDKDTGQGPGLTGDLIDPPDSPQVKPSQDRK